MGSPIPLVLRLTVVNDSDNESVHQHGFVGHCFVHGIMDGRLSKPSRVSWISLDSFDSAMEVSSYGAHKAFDAFKNFPLRNWLASIIYLYRSRVCRLGVMKIMTRHKNRNRSVRRPVERGRVRPVPG